MTKKARKPEQGDVISHRIECLKAARRYCARGFSVLPIEIASPGEAGSGKRPLTLNGYKDATSKYGKFRRLVEKLDDFNIAIAVTPESGLLVLDYDPRNAERGTISKLKAEHGALPKGPKALTGGGGSHRFFRRPEGTHLKNCELAPGVEVKANGYVVVEPSEHASGKRYEWADGRRLEEIEATPALPDGWLKAILARQTPKAVNVSTPLEPGAVIPEGQRNTSLTSEAGRLRALGCDGDRIASELQRINRERCQPPLDAEEVRRIVSSISRYEPPEGVGEPGPAERVVRMLLAKHYLDGKHIRFERDGSFYSYVGTHWARTETTAIQKQLLALIRQDSPADRKRMMPLANEAMALLRVEVSTGSDDLLHFTSDPPQVINVQNGELWLLPDGQVELRPHQPATGIRHVLPVRYDPASNCTEYDKALTEIFSNAGKPSRVVKVWNQLVGYAIQPSRQRPAIVILLGAGANGKTKLVETIARLLGGDAVYSGDIVRLEASPFGVGGLVGKLLFKDDDVKAGARLPDGILKKISEGKQITGERKHKDPFEFVCRALPVLLCNNVPSLADLTHGIRRRLIVVPFNRSFTPEEQDKELFPRIWANELSGVLNRALEGWQEFVANGHEFSLSKAIDKACAALLMRANPLVAYIEESCIKDLEASVDVAGLYNDFLRWAKEVGIHSPPVRNKLRQQLIDLGYSVKMVRGYPMATGLKLKRVEALGSSD